MAPTTTVETVSVVRPIKVLALVCSIIALILLIITISSAYWLWAEDYYQGLWQECVTVDGETLCSNNNQDPYIIACGAMCIIACLLALGGTVLTGAGLFSKNPDTKYKLYRLAMVIMFVAMLFVVISVIVFPIMFMQEIEERGKEQWYFGWAYGVAWGAAIFLTGAAILLLLDKETDEIYFREKTYEYEA